jgi:DNA repair exonuclease SbcCD ATPase subunit
MLTLASAGLGPLFPWIESGGFDRNWAEGLGLIALGVVGALVTIYVFLGDWLPSMGGKADYEALKIEIDNLKRRWNKQINLRERYTIKEAEIASERIAEADKLCTDLAAEIEARATEAGSLRRNLSGVGLPLYAILGGAFAVLFAENAAQAILIGFGWTAIADRLGLKRELDKKTERREQEISKLEEEADAAESAREELKAVKRALTEANQQLATRLAANDSPGAGQAAETKAGGAPAGEAAQETK